MNYIRSIFLSFLFISNAFGHESENDHHYAYSFKDKIHGMCIGHHHMDDIELKEICNHFSEHFSDTPGPVTPQANRPEITGRAIVRLPSGDKKLTF
jgi:hypothetical protein